MSDVSPAVEAMITDQGAMVATASLDEFITAYDQDSNLWWRIACGHHQNLFEAASDRIEELQRQLEDREEQLDQKVLAIGRVEDQITEELTHGPLASYYALRMRNALEGKPVEDSS